MANTAKKVNAASGKNAVKNTNKTASKSTGKNAVKGKSATKKKKFKPEYIAYIVLGVILIAIIVLIIVIFSTTPGSASGTNVTLPPCCQ